MEVLYPCCCGLDVHKKSITACVLWAKEKGKSRREKRRFGPGLISAPAPFVTRNR
jgi:transposase